jgi:hypothetical protein
MKMPLDDENSLSTYPQIERREAVTKEDMLHSMRRVVKEAIATAPQLSAEEAEWVRAAIKIQAQRIALRKAIIEKTFVGLVWAAIVATGTYVANYFHSHWI